MRCAKKNGVIFTIINLAIVNNDCFNYDTIIVKGYKGKEEYESIKKNQFYMYHHTDVVITKLWKIS